MAKLAVVAAVCVVLVAATGGVASGTPQDCAPWTSRTVATGVGVIESLMPDGRGGMVVADRLGALKRVTRDGRTTTLVRVAWPGELQRRGSTMWFTSGDSPQAGLLGTRDGTIDQLNLDDGSVTTWASGLAMPNGLTFLPDGDAVVSRTTGPAPLNPTGITRVPATAPRDPQFNWADLGDTDGLAVDPSRTWLYTDQTFTFDSAVYRIRIADPGDIEPVAHLASLGTPQGLDDLTIDRDGVLYLAAHTMGNVIRLDPTTGSACVIAHGLDNPSATAFGDGPGWPPGRLYVSCWDGRIVELTPPGSSGEVH
jgi:sugar lactone lactonase YvrE